MGKTPPGFGELLHNKMNCQVEVGDRIESANGVKTLPCRIVQKMRDEDITCEKDDASYAGPLRLVITHARSYDVTH